MEQSTKSSPEPGDPYPVVQAEKAKKRQFGSSLKIIGVSAYHD